MSEDAAAVERPLGQVMRTTWRIAMTAYAGLLGLQVVWHLVWLPPTTAAPWLVTLIFVLPLLLPLRGLLRARPRSFAVTSLITLFYLMHGLVELSAVGDSRWPAALEVGLGALLFLGCILFTKGRSRELRMREVD